MKLEPMCADVDPVVEHHISGLYTTMLMESLLGRLSADDASQLAASRRGNAPAMALLLAVSAWATDSVPQEEARTAEVLAAAGWRVAVVTASTPLASAWQQLHRPADRPLPVGGFDGSGHPGVRSGDA